jgi:TRAP transporter 4TM/12TM fusion protein
MFFTEKEVRMMKDDTEVTSKNDSGIAAKLFKIVAVTMGLYHMSSIVYPVFSPVEHMNIHLAFALCLVFLAGFIKNSRRPAARFIDLIFLAAAIFCSSYIMTNFVRMNTKVGLVTTEDFIVGIMLIVVVLEATRRTFGIALPILTMASIIYGCYGDYFPGFFHHAGFDWMRLVASLTTNFTGVFGPILDISASFIVLFMIFGGMLDASGAGKFFIDFAMSIGGKTKSGPAQAAIISSGLVGSINGSAVANVATTGVFTIPLMKKCGYSKEMAGAVESVASTGGMIMPPVMGVGAFVMSGITGIAYTKIAVSALIPALLYYYTAGISAHLYALKHKFQPMNEDDIPDLKKVLKEGGHFILPLLAIIYYMGIGLSVMRAGFNGIIVLVAIRPLQQLRKFPKAPI